MQPVAERRELTLLERASDQRDAKGQAVGAEASRNRERRQIHEIDEVGVDAEVRVEAHGIGQHLLDAVDGRRGRQQEHVHLGPFVLRGTRELGKGVERLEGRDGVDLVRTAYDLTHDLMQGAGM